MVLNLNSDIIYFFYINPYIMNHLSMIYGMYFNKNNYKFYHAFEKKMACELKEYNKEDFICVPQPIFSQMEGNFFIFSVMENKGINRRKWGRKLKNASKNFYFFIDDNDLIEKWEQFLKVELQITAKQWCDAEKISYILDTPSPEVKKYWDKDWRKAQIEAFIK